LEQPRCHWAGVGVFSVASYTVAQRIDEIGLRLALGARPDQIRRLVLRQGMYPVAIGLAAGVIAAVAVGRILSGLLFGISATDPMTIAGVAALVSAVAAAATHLPARRASRIDPMVALRFE
jgi:putative ABC transport system permease protein